MEGRADGVYAAHLRLGRFLPLPLVVTLSLLRGLAANAVSFLVGTPDATAPAYVVVTRCADGSLVGRLSAGREPYVGEALLQSVQLSMSTLTAEEFVQHWHLDPR